MDTDLTVLFVCTGNLNRSAIAAALFRRWAEWYLPAPLAGRVAIASAGLSAPVRSHAPAPTAAIARELGADLAGHRAVQLTESAVGSADLVLVASRNQVDGVVSLMPSALNSTLTIREAGRIAASVPVEAGPPRSPAALRRRLELLDRRRLSSAGSVAADTGDDIVDPQGQPYEAHIEMARQEVPALARVAGLLFGMPPLEITAYDEAVGAADFGRSGRSEDRPRS